MPERDPEIEEKTGIDTENGESIGPGATTPSQMPTETPSGGGQPGSAVHETPDTGAVDADPLDE